MDTQDFGAIRSNQEAELAAAQIERQRQLAMALQAQANRPLQGQMVGSHYVAPSWTEGLSRLAQAYMGRRGMQGADQNAVALAERKAMLQGEQIDDYFADDTSMDAGTKAKIKAAAVSGNPMLAALVTASLKAKEEAAAKNTIGAKDLLPYTAPTAIPNLVTQGTTGFTPKAETKEVNGVVYSVGTGTDGKPVLTPVEGNPQMKTELINGDLYEVNPVTNSRRKLDNAPKVNVSQSMSPVNKGESEFLKTLGKESAEAISNARKAKHTGQQTLSAVSQLETLDKAGTFSGPTANIATGLAAFADTIGVPVDKTKLANSDAYRSQIAQQISTYLTAGSGVGRSLTDQDRKVLEQQFPALIVTPTGRQAIFQILRRAAQKDIDYANNIHQKLKTSSNPDFQEAASLFDIDPSTVDYNEGGTAPAEPVIDLNDYLKKQKQGK
jgi:hypothetical protein